MNDEIDIPLDEIDQFIEENREIDIDMDQFIAYQRLKYEKESEMEIFEVMASEMRECISQGDLGKATEIAEELKGCNYLGFKADIDECFRICADAGIVSAMRHMIWKHQNNGNQFPISDSFAYLKKLSDLGYVKSFNPLGQCYYHGIGCEVSYEHAAEEFMKGYIFARDAFCVKMLMRIMNNSTLEGTRIRSLYEKLFDDGRIRLSINQIAVMIYNREIRDYPPDAAYYLLFNQYRAPYYEDCLYDGEEDEDFSYGDIPYCLAKCILDGIGIDPCPVLAEHVLESAEDEYDWRIRYGHDADEAKLNEVMDLEIYVERQIAGAGYPCSDDLFDDWLEEDMEFIYNNPNQTMQRYAVFGSCYNESLISIDRHGKPIPIEKEIQGC